MIDITGVKMKGILDNYKRECEEAEAVCMRALTRSAVNYGDVLSRQAGAYDAAVARAWHNFKMAVEAAHEKYNEGVKHEAKKN